MRAPITGLVSKIDVTVGNIVTGGVGTGTTLTTLVSVDPIYCGCAQRNQGRFAKEVLQGLLCLLPPVHNPAFQPMQQTRGVRSTITTSSACRTIQSGIVSRTRMPVMFHTWSFRLSRCCTFIVVRTSMPASSITSTSSHRLARSKPGTLVCGNSSTTHTLGCLARIASVSISSNWDPR